MKNKLLILLLLSFLLNGCSKNEEIRSIEESSINLEEAEQENYNSKYETTNTEEQLIDSNYDEWIQLNEGQTVIVGNEVQAGIYDVKCAEGINYYDFNVFENQKAFNDFNREDENIDWLDHYNNYYVLKDDKTKLTRGIDLKEGNIIDVMWGGIALKNISSKNNSENSKSSKTEDNIDVHLNQDAENLNNDLNKLNSWSFTLGDYTSSGAQKILPSIYNKIEEMHNKIQGYIDNPTSYTLRANVDLLNDYSELLEMYENMSGETLSYDENSKLIKTQNEMIFAQLDLPEINMD